jgi:ribosomal protein L29
MSSTTSQEDFNMAITITIPGLSDIGAAMQKTGEAMQVRAQEKAVEKQAGELIQLRRQKKLEQYRAMSVEELDAEIKALREQLKQ